MDKQRYNVALVGNPNSGKSSLFNALAGTRQHVGNYPGVTVDIKSAKIPLDDVRSVTLLDMPGLYSMFTTGAEGQLVVDTLLSPDHQFNPDLVVYTVDARQLETQLLLFTQLSDLGLPMILAVNMLDEVSKDSIDVDLDLLQKNIGVKVVGVSARTGHHLQELKREVADALIQTAPRPKPFFRIPSDQEELAVKVLGLEASGVNIYRSVLKLHHPNHLGREQLVALEAAIHTGNFAPLPAQVEETMARSETIKRLTAFVITPGSERRFDSGWFDKILTHRVAGPLIFVAIMLFVFQAIFAWATYPMDWIEAGFAALGTWVGNVMPEGWVSSLIIDGLIAGLSGVLVFVPQIAILFFLITLLEEVGYMARAVYLFDRFMQRVGMNGRSVVALISGGACAIPAIMSTRTIENWKERLITILVTPFISCSARIPVFALLVAFVVPYKPVWGVFNSQGLVFTGLYLMGIVTAFLSSWVFKMILNSRDPSFLMLELPPYCWPHWSNVWVQLRFKVGSFVTEAGKIIVLISLVLWFLASFGPPKKMQVAEELAQQEAAERRMSPQERDNLVASYLLEASFAGTMGKLIEPVIRPLGYDWKIGVALITSFAAREVFVGSMATIYSVGSEETLTVREQLASVVDPITGKPVFNRASALSLLFFFVLAMQCMSTMAVVRKETGSWKWPLIQFTFMLVLAYGSALAAYQILN